MCLQTCVQCLSAPSHLCAGPAVAPGQPLKPAGSGTAPEICLQNWETAVFMLPFFLSHQSSARLELCSNRVVLMLSNSHTKPAAVLPRTSPAAFTRPWAMAQLHFAAATTHSLLPATLCAATASPKHPPAASHSSDKMETASYYCHLKQLCKNQPKPHM